MLFVHSAQVFYPAAFMLTNRSPWAIIEYIDVWCH